MTQSDAMGEVEQLADELAQLARLAVEQKEDDLRLLIARLARRHRRHLPDLSAQLVKALESAAHHTLHDVSRRIDFGDSSNGELLPIRRFNDRRGDIAAPILTPPVMQSIEQIIDEWQRAEELYKRGLAPVASTIFTGPPGVGKTYTARWLASQLNLPLFVLDLTAVMSSRLGQSGANLRAALDYARQAPSVLFLDEVDSIAKRRSDDSDVGELKRLVTIMLQELDDWPSTSFLVAATNHAELVDPALWRRFDLHIDFPMPDRDGIETTIYRYLGDELQTVTPYIPLLQRLLQSSSYSEIEKVINRVRKHVILGNGDVAASLEGIVRGNLSDLPRSERINIASDLQMQSSMSQHQISRIMGVSRDTLRKRARRAEGATNV